MNTKNYNRYLRVRDCRNFTFDTFEDMLAVDGYLREFTGNEAAEIRPEGLFDGNTFLEDQEAFFDWMEMQPPLPKVPDWMPEAPGGAAGNK